MLKRSGAFVLTMLYIVTVLGFALNLRYCGKIITSVEINLPAKAGAKDLISAKMRCCKDKHIDIKIKDAHQSETHSFLIKALGFELAQLPFKCNFHFAQEVLPKKHSDKDPPNWLSANNPIFLKNQSFRI